MRVYTEWQVYEVSIILFKIFCREIVMFEKLNHQVVQIFNDFGSPKEGYLDFAVFVHLIRIVILYHQRRRLQWKSLPVFRIVSRWYYYPNVTNIKLLKLWIIYYSGLVITSVRHHSSLPIKLIETKKTYCIDLLGERAKSSYFMLRWWIKTPLCVCVSKITTKCFEDRLGAKSCSSW